MSCIYIYLLMTSSLRLSDGNLFSLCHSLDLLLSDIAGDDIEIAGDDLLSGQ